MLSYGNVRNNSNTIVDQVISRNISNEDHEKYIVYKQK